MNQEKTGISSLYMKLLVEAYMPRLVVVWAVDLENSPPRGVSPAVHRLPVLALANLHN